MKATIQSVKGTRDFYPEDMAIRSWLYQVIREVSESFGYQEYDAPFLERIDLYAAKSGEELVKEQAFVFQDRSGDLITLRPELTPSLARMVAQRQNELAFPLRWWSFGPFWRYERPQKGRTREFFQWNIDLIGPNSPEVDAELVAVCAAFFQKVGLTPKQVKILVNNRELMDEELAKLGIQNELKKSTFHLIDRKDKLSPQAWEAYAAEAGFSSLQFQGVKNLLTDPDLWQHSDAFIRFFKAVGSLGVADYVQFDPQIIRGLDYYTGTVFEAKDLDGGRSLLGGGRYNNLVSDVGGDPLPAVGFAMGDVMATLVLQKYGCIPDYVPVKAAVLVTVFDEGLLNGSLSLSADLHQAGIQVICYPEAAKLPKQLKFADRMGIRYAVIMGPDEAANGVVTVKDLAARTQTTVERSTFAEHFKKMLAQANAL
ncbi:MAG TPA: histidine--tRNA ligase [Anaerolineaceae bacterium]|nr:histidine--tRNA ligase [Anaerolineaceae bacterium]